MADLLLLATEVVTNAVRHSGEGAADVEVVVDVDSDTVRVAVRDSGPGFERRPTGDPRGSRMPESSGWGLYLVERLAERWGVERRPDGNEVWFELALDED
jgi:anti-sigma regulatory factor (Ser/Thr protein kinase)